MIKIFKYIISYIGTITLLILFTFCTQNISGKENNVIKIEPNVIIIGHEYNENGIMVACYWLNGQKITLTDGTNRATANAITMKGNNIYIAGTESTGHGGQVSYYWINEHRITLTNGEYYSSVYDIDVLENDIFVAGWDMEANNNIWIACYWKNGQRITLKNNDVLRTELKSISLVDNNIYIGGYVNLGFRPGLGSIDACYWLNENRISLPNVTYYDYASSIIKNKNDLYVLGGKFGQDDDIVWYCKNREIIILENNNKFARVTDMYIFNDDIYISGCIEIDDEIIVACYWKNGKLVYLTDGKYDSQSSGIIVY